MLTVRHVFGCYGRLYESLVAMVTLQVARDVIREELLGTVCVGCYEDLGLCCRRQPPPVVFDIVVILSS